MKALKTRRESTPRLSLPTRLTKKTKRETTRAAMITESGRKRRRRIPKLYPIIELIETTVTMHNAGCKRDEIKTLPRLANDVVESTNKRSMIAPRKPKRQSLTQTLKLLRTTLMSPPSKIKPNHIRQEKRERPEQRLKSNIGSFLRQMW